MAITNFIPEIWSANLLAPLQKSYVFAPLANRNYEGEVSQQGDTVHITSLGGVKVGDYTPHTDIEVEALTDTDTVLAIDQAKYFAFEADDIEKRQAAGDFMNQSMTDAANALADVSDTFLASLMAANAGTKLPAVTSDDPAAAYKALVGLRTALDKNNVPTQGRWVVVSPDVYAELLLDPRFVNASDSAHTVLLNGVVGQAAGFQVSMSNNLPTVTSAQTLIAGSPLATTYAEQISNVEATRKERGFADIVKGLHVYGAKVTRPTALATVDYTVADPAAPAA